MAMATNNNNRSWNILNWNIRGINEEDKCKAVKEKIEESVAVVYCIQETKRTSFDPFFVKNLLPDVSTNSFTPPLEGHQVALLWAGMSQSSRVKLWKSICLLSQSISPPTTTMTYGP